MSQTLGTNLEDLKKKVAETGPLRSGAVCPAVPKTIDELGVLTPLLTDLCLRYLREHPNTTVTKFRKALKLSFPIAEALIQEFRNEQLIEVKGMQGRDYVVSLTRTGRDHAVSSTTQCRYAGPVPVPLNQYTRTVRAQSLKLNPTFTDLRRATSDMILDDEILDQLGAALCSGKPLFVYGPSGNGKTSVIERLPRLFDDTVLIPYSIEVDGKIIAIFDPTVHIPADLENPDEAVDARWIRCRRPCVVAGGELTLEHLMPRLDANSGIYAPPLHLRAVNGMLLIDDFGRQMISPQKLFNRWIIPLDRRVDHLSLKYGYTFEIPFEVALVFSTNMEPAELVDEAFIRRVPNKIHMAPLSPEIFDEIFGYVVAQRNLPVNGQSCASLAAYLREVCLANGAQNLRACYPGDVCNVIECMAAYDRKPFSITPQYLARAARLYFMHRLV